MRFLFAFIILYCINLFSQVTHTSLTNFPSQFLENEKNKFLLIRPSINYDSYTQNYQQITLKDFDFRINKPIKSVNYYLNDNKNISYTLKFNKNGNIIKLDDFINNYQKTYNYLHNCTIIKKFLKKENNRLAIIDSIIYNSNNDIVKKSSTHFESENIMSEHFVEEYEYDNTNTLLKKYQYLIDYKNPISTTLIQACQYDYLKNKIIEKQVSAWLLYNRFEFKKDSLLFRNFQEKIYHLNTKGQIFKIEEKVKDRILNFLDIRYDNQNRLTSITSSEIESFNTFYKYQNENIIEIANNEDKTTFRYDKNGNVIYMTGFLSYDITSTYTHKYDSFKNWTHSINSNKNLSIYKIVREIEYY